MSTDKRETPDTSYNVHTDDHDSSATLTYRGVSVTITLRNRTFTDSADSVLVLIDTDPERDDLSLVAYVNEAAVFDGVIR